MELCQTVPAPVADAPSHTPSQAPSQALPVPLPLPLGERVQLLVAEYAGALAPALVVAVAEAAAAALRALGAGAGAGAAAGAGAGADGEDFASAWLDTTRRRLSDQVVLELASARRAELAGGC